MSTTAAGRLLNEVDSKQLLESGGIRTAGARLARTREEAAAIAAEAGLPAVLKVVSDDVAHKSDVGGVRLDLNSLDEVKQAYDQIVQAVTDRQPDARIDGVSVQRMAETGLEVIIGMNRDPQFGPVMMFGLGGVMVGS
jgi:acyl-CoA synthetase (NDP forming)